MFWAECFTFVVELKPDVFEFSPHACVADKVVFVEVVEYDFFLFVFKHILVYKQSWYFCGESCSMAWGDKMLVRCCAESGSFCKRSSASISAETKALDPNSMPASMRR